MWKKLEPIMQPYESLHDLSNMLLHLRQLIGELERHRKISGDTGRNAAIDAIIELLQAEKVPLE